ncbi:hypothetical protein V1J52_10745 [Streptomyces sp. TRM 70351]|uniref:hypothetical protein n=1 Tax=Streptomyces sp. TRM 70351 TaxID=3116552 RepID=UPI002E7C5260|nr:hypothetical protein [Streptomyces sp. TRM 70351]MEE1928667.1 hypothetical protein [Streptomyces sp. TRM 70351]
MAWTWQFESADGSGVDSPVPVEEFSTQGDAESWIGENWKELLDRGVDQARLLEDGAEVYGPMSLHADDAG